MNQKKAKFNIVDIVVILLLITSAVFVSIRMLGGQSPAAANSAQSTSRTYRVTFFADCVPEAVANSLVESSRSENAPQNTDLGALVDITISPSYTFSFDSNGICVQSENPGYVSVSLVCELTGVQQTAGLQVGQFMLKVGHCMDIRCGNTKIDTIIQNITLVTAG